MKLRNILGKPEGWVRRLELIAERRTQQYLAITDPHERVRWMWRHRRIYHRLPEVTDHWRKWCRRLFAVTNLNRGHATPEEIEAFKLAHEISEEKAKKRGGA